IVYSGLTIAFVGLICLVKPIRRLGIPTRSRALAMAGLGALAAAIGFALPAPESRISRAETQLDEFAPVWQFSEFHTLRIAAPPGTRGKLPPEVVQKPLPPGFVLATMNFVVTPDGNSGSVVSTETRVFANSPSTRRQFAVYWRLIYPGSAIIRRMWLRAVA